MRKRSNLGLASKIALATLGLVGLVGCRENKPEINLPTPEKPYFASLPMSSQSGMAMTSGDFDKDGDLDVIVGFHEGSLANGAKLYFLENDGEGNFTFKQYQNTGEQ